MDQETKDKVEQREAALKEIARLEDAKAKNEEELDFLKGELAKKKAAEQPTAGIEKKIKGLHGSTGSLVALINKHKDSMTHLTKEEKLQADANAIHGSDNDSMSKTRAILRRQKKVSIEIPSTELDKDPVNVGINGNVFRIPRDKRVDVPQEVVNVLNDAKVMGYIMRKRQDDGEGNEMVSTEGLRIPFQVYLD